MSGSTFGNQFKITTFGESHGDAIGVVIDGCPAGLALCENDIQLYLNRRKPGQSEFSTPRKEADTVHIQSGIFEGLTTGTPISMVIYNESQRSGDYSEIASYYRPGHADYTYDCKYGFRDYRGGGRSSGRETIGRVAAGAVAAKILQKLGVVVTAYTESIGPVSIDPSHLNLNEALHNPLVMPDENAALRATEYLKQCMSETDSVGGIIVCQVTGVPSGIGEPVFDKLSANLAKAILSIGSVKGFEIGDGFQSAAARGSQNNDSFYLDNGIIRKNSNHAGGILGGISDGDTIYFRAAIKPTPSIYKTQQTINRNGEEISINIKGRHDPIIVPRAVVVVESMTDIVLVDMMFANMTSRMSEIERFYKQ